MAQDTKGTGAHGLNRRSLLIGASAALAAPLVITGRARADTTLTVTCWGGDYRAGVERCFAKPFTEATGIAVRLVDNADLARMKAQVESGRVEWDVFDSVGPQITAGAKDNLWEPVDTKIVDRSDLFVPGGPTYVGTYMFAGGLAFDPKRTPAEKAPADFAAFWDVKTYPGRRGLRPRISETLEMALIASGVEPSKLYPLDVERGFAALDKIKPHIKKWIETTPQTVTLITANELDFTYSYISRVRPAEIGGASIGISTKQTLNSLEYLAVPKGTPNREAAMRYVNFVLKPDRQTAFAEMLFFSPNSKAGLAAASPAARQYMPDLKNPANAVVNDEWWSDNYAKLQKRFTEWLLI